MDTDKYSKGTRVTWQNRTGHTLHGTVDLSHENGRDVYVQFDGSEAFTLLNTSHLVLEDNAISTMRADLKNIQDQIQTTSETIVKLDADRRECVDRLQHLQNDKKILAIKLNHAENDSMRELLQRMAKDLDVGQLVILRRQVDWLIGERSK